MNRLFEFLRSIYVFVLFVAIEAVAIHYYARSSYYTEARVLSRTAYATGWARGVLHGVGEFFDLPDENRRLLARVVELENELGRYREIQALSSIDTLSNPMGAPYAYTTARVVSASINRRGNYLLLKRSSSDDTAPESAVITPDGAMVGYVVASSDRYAVAMPILNTSFRASGKVKGDTHYGSISWNGSDAAHVQMHELSKYAAIREGDSIVSTGFSRYFPEGILIGRVERFALNETKTAYDVEIRLAADLSALYDAVLVRNEDFGEMDLLLEQSRIRTE